MTTGTVVFPEVTLVKRSDGDRGAYGNQKVYSIKVVRYDHLGSWIVFMDWGRAELPAETRMCTEKIFKSEDQALAFAWAKFYEKIDKGYTEKN